jgi:DNA-binding MarR family transcriptional regulator
MTSLLDTLERRNLVRRRPHPHDRRRLLVDMTDESRALVDRFLPEVHAWQHRVMSVLSRSEQTTLLRLLAKLQTGLRDGPPPVAGAGPRRPRRRR